MGKSTASLRPLFYVLALSGVLLFFLMAGKVLLPFALALFLTYLLNPLVVVLTRRGFGRLGAVYFIVALLFLLTVLFLLYVLPILLSRLESFIGDLPRLLQDLEEFFQRREEEMEHILLRGRLGSLLLNFTEEVRELFLTFMERTLQGITSLFSQIFSLLLAPILAFYFLRDWEELGKGLRSYLPAKEQERLSYLGRELDQVLGGFIRGQILASILVGSLIGIGLACMGVESSLIFGILAGITNLIPYLGPILGAIPPILMTLFQDPMQAIGVLVLFVVIQQLESWLISPRVFSSTLGLHPLPIFFSLLAGGYLFGFLGLILAVPLAGVVKIILNLIQPYLFFYQEKGGG